MSLNDTPSAERIHIGIFGQRNAGKSSLINALTSQSLAIVSEQKGTTTDPVSKSMELLPLGPVIITDTPGLDDVGELGKLRVEKAQQVLNKTDLALLVIDAALGPAEEDFRLWRLIQEKHIPGLVVLNKSDLLLEVQQVQALSEALQLTDSGHILLVSSQSGSNIYELKEALTRLRPVKKEQMLLDDLLQPLDLVVLVTPIDKAAPKGRLILPQQLVLRNALDNGARILVVRDTELADLPLTVKPRLVITDSQVFAKVSKIIPKELPLTSFSILMARYKGILASAIKATRLLDSLKDGDRVLISEGCTHHRQCNDIGTVKLPQLIRRFTQAEPDFSWTSGTEFPKDLSSYKLIIHCGGCMLNEREMQYRNDYAHEQGIPMTNYGLAIAYMNGLLERSLAPLPGYAELLQK